MGMWQHLSPSSFLSQRETPQLLPLHTDTYHGNRNCDVSRVGARLVTSTIVLLGDKGLVSPSWQQLLGLHVSWEERKGSLLKHRQEKEEKITKQKIGKSSTRLQNQMGGCLHLWEFAVP